MKILKNIKRVMCRRMGSKGQLTRKGGADPNESGVLNEQPRATITEDANSVVDSDLKEAEGVGVTKSKKNDINGEVDKTNTLEETERDDVSSKAASVVSETASEAMMSKSVGSEAIRQTIAETLAQVDDPAMAEDRAPTGNAKEEDEEEREEMAELEDRNEETTKASDEKTAASATKEKLSSVETKRSASSPEVQNADDMDGNRSASFSADANYASGGQSVIELSRRGIDYFVKAGQSMIDWGSPSKTFGLGAVAEGNEEATEASLGAVSHELVDSDVDGMRQIVESTSSKVDEPGLPQIEESTDVESRELASPDINEAETDGKADMNGNSGVRDFIAKATRDIDGLSSCPTDSSSRTDDLFDPPTNQTSPTGNKVADLKLKVQRLLQKKKTTEPNQKENSTTIDSDDRLAPEGTATKMAKTDSEEIVPDGGTATNPIPSDVGENEKSGMSLENGNDGTSFQPEPAPVAETSPVEESVSAGEQNSCDKISNSVDSLTDEAPDIASNKDVSLAGTAISNDNDVAEELPPVSDPSILLESGNGQDSSTSAVSKYEDSSALEELIQNTRSVDGSVKSGPESPRGNATDDSSSFFISSIKPSISKDATAFTANSLDTSILTMTSKGTAATLKDDSRSRDTSFNQTLSKEASMKASRSKDLTLKESKSRDLSIKETLSKEASIKASRSKDSLREDVSLKQTASKDKSIKASGSKDIPLKESLSRDISLKQSRSKDTSVKTGRSRDFSLRLSKSRDTSIKASRSKDMSLKESKSRERLHKQRSKDTTLEDNVGQGAGVAGIQSKDAPTEPSSDHRDNAPADEEGDTRASEDMSLKTTRSNLSLQQMRRRRRHDRNTDMGIKITRSNPSPRSTSESPPNSVRALWPFSPKSPTLSPKSHDKSETAEGDDGQEPVLSGSGDLVEMKSELENAKDDQDGQDDVDQLSKEAEKLDETIRTIAASSSMNDSAVQGASVPARGLEGLGEEEAEVDETQVGVTGDEALDGSIAKSTDDVGLSGDAPTKPDEAKDDDGMNLPATHTLPTPRASKSNNAVLKKSMSSEVSVSNKSMKSSSSRKSGRSSRSRRSQGSATARKVIESKPSTNTESQEAMMKKEPEARDVEPRNEVVGEDRDDGDTNEVRGNDEGDAQDNKDRSTEAVQDDADDGKKKESGKEGEDKLKLQKKDSAEIATVASTIFTSFSDNSVDEGDVIRGPSVSSNMSSVAEGGGSKRGGGSRRSTGGGSRRGRAAEGVAGPSGSNVSSSSASSSTQDGSLVRYMSHRADNKERGFEVLFDHYMDFTSSIAKNYSLATEEGREGVGADDGSKHSRRSQRIKKSKSRDSAVERKKGEEEMNNSKARLPTPAAKAPPQQEEEKEEISVQVKRPACLEEGNAEQTSSPTVSNE